MMLTHLSKCAASALAAANEEMMPRPLPSETAVITASVLPNSKAISRLSTGFY